MILRLSDRLRQIRRLALASPHELWVEASVAESDGRRTHAQFIYRKLAAKKIRNAVTCKYAALARRKSGDNQGAIAVLEAGAARYPDLDGDLKIDLISHLFEQNRTALAERYSDEVVLARDAVIPMFRLGDVLQRFDQATRAESIFKHLKSRALNDAADYYFAGVSAFRLGESEVCYGILEEGYRKYPQEKSLQAIYIDICQVNVDYDRYARFLHGSDSGGAEAIQPSKKQFFLAASKVVPPALLPVKYSELKAILETAELGQCIRSYLQGITGEPKTFEAARDDLLYAIYTNANANSIEFFFDICCECASPTDRSGDLFKLRVIKELTGAINSQNGLTAQEVIERFTNSCNSLAQAGVRLTLPVHDLTNTWTPWVHLFCLAEPALYAGAMSAFESFALKTWPGLQYCAEHCNADLPAVAEADAKIRVGFFTLDSMPMMSGLAAFLDKNLFETVYIRPGAPGGSDHGRNWVARADRTVEVSPIDAFSAIETIAAEKIDILISGPSTASLLYPAMARLASLQIVHLEPNWTDGFSNSDYYISWGAAEPKHPAEFYKTSVAYLSHPPYWIERPSTLIYSQSEIQQVRQRLLSDVEGMRLYLCANASTKVHEKMDPVFLDILARDDEAVLVFLREEFPPTKNLQARLRNRLGQHFDRVVFLPSLSQRDAHLLLLASDCCLDSFPMCGMSSSFDGMMQGVPIVTLPTPIPFGCWTAAIYDYIEVSGLTARDESEYVDIAIRLAIDKAWHREKSQEIKEKSARYVESRESAAQFQQFLLDAWGRREKGLPATNWIEGAWH